MGQMSLISLDFWVERPPRKSGTEGTAPASCRFYLFGVGRSLSPGVPPVSVPLLNAKKKTDRVRLLLPDSLGNSLGELLGTVVEVELPVIVVVEEEELDEDGRRLGVFDDVELVALFDASVLGS